MLKDCKILYKEQHDLGIYKAQGFSTRKIRLAFALRFGIVALIGAILGILISAWCTDTISTSFLQMIGISRFISHPSLLQLLSPGLIVILLFMMFAYLQAGKIKQIEPVILISE